MNKNRAASIRAKLLALAKREGQTFQLILIRYFHERLLYRLSLSRYRSHFCLKGGTLLYAWEGLKSRPTKDVDFLGMQIANDTDVLREVFCEIIAESYEEDGVLFDASDVEAENITNEEPYAGIRIHLTARLDTIRQRIQVDIGFGDRIIPHPVTLIYPTLLDLDAPHVQAYSVESVIAEKFEAMLDLAEANSRYKDFYDVYQLLGSSAYQPQTLQTAIQETCRRRGTRYREGHSLFTESFAGDENRQRQWQAFFKRAGIATDLTFIVVMDRIRQQLRPMYEAMASG